MRCLSGLALLGSLAIGQPCIPAPEIMYVQDASVSLRAVRQQMVATYADTIERLVDGYGSIRFGVAAFVDKPIPFRGLGGRNVIPHVDVCYELGVGLTSEVGPVLTALRGIREMSGGDGPENPYEALIDAAADKNSIWSPIGTFGPGGEVPVRIVVIVTDDMPHLEGDAALGIEMFNAPRYPKERKVGGFGHPSLVNYVNGVYTGAPPLSVADYLNFCDAWYKVDNGTATDDDIETQAEGLELFGPPTWDPVLPHPGTYVPGTECQKYEYPSLASVSKALTDAQILPIVLVTKPPLTTKETRILCQNRGFDPDQIVDCLIRSYKSDFAEMGVAATVESFESAEEIESTLRKTIAQAVDTAGCFPLTPRPTTPPTTPRPVPTQPFPHPEDDDASSSTKRIVGGACGGAAGGALVLIGAVAYRRYNKEEPNYTEELEQADGPTSSVERESLEPVDFTMFV